MDNATLKSVRRIEEELISRLPPIRGRYRAFADLGKTTWFQVGGPAEMLFKPEDANDLADFLRECPKDIPVTILGVGSNLLVRDGGIDGVVIKLGRGFTDISVEGELIHAGAGAMDVHVADVAYQRGLAGLEFLSGIPGGIGGALAMNAGAYGSDVSEILVEAEAVFSDGSVRVLPKDELEYSYRHCGLLGSRVESRESSKAAARDSNHSTLVTPIFTRATFRGTPGAQSDIAGRMAEIAEARGSTQPVRSRTGGSTFKNPEPEISGGKKAWQLIEASGCRGLKIGGAQVSEKHCNFLINLGQATAADLENLGEQVRARVLEYSGIALEWEIKRAGKR